MSLKNAAGLSRSGCCYYYYYGYYYYYYNYYYCSLIKNMALSQGPTGADGGCARERAASQLLAFRCSTKNNDSSNGNKKHKK